MQAIDARLRFLIVLLLAIYCASCVTVAESSTGYDLEDDELSDEPAADSSSIEPPEKSPPTLDPTPAIQTSLAHIYQALSVASANTIGVQRLPPEPLTYREILDPQRSIEGSLSVGTIRQGTLRNAVALNDVGEFHEIIERHRSRRTRYGTAELVAAIKGAAESVAREHGGAPLRVGNLGFRSGGAIPWSNSHEAGRDADLAFYVLTEEGESVPAPDLIAFDNDGQARSDSLIFDIPRNWALIRALLTDPTINVQWLFISEGLKHLLLTHALEIGEDVELIARAARIVHQPTDAAPHDDHLHLRIGCSLTDRLEGCVDWGPQWDWYDWHDSALLARTLEVRRVFFKEEPDKRIQALDYLHRIRSPYAADVALFFGIHDDERSVRQRAFDILEDISLRSLAAVKHLGIVLDMEGLSVVEREILYRLLRRVTLSEAVDVAWQRYQSPSLPVEERALALRALDHHMDLDLVTPILEALSDEEHPRLRQLLARLFHRITARTDGLDWNTISLTDEHRAALQIWNQWWSNLDEDSRDRHLLLQEFLARKGFHQWEDLTRVDELIPLLRSESDHIRYTVNIVLRQWTGRWVPRDWERPLDAFRSWSRWWDRNRERMINRQPQPWE